MSADWKAGDRALCVEAFVGRWTLTNEKYAGPLPRVGTIYLVIDVGPVIEGSVGLLLADLPDDGFWRATKFRKLVPACDRVEIEREAEA